MNRSRIKRYSLLLVVTLLLALSSFVVQAADTLVILHTNDTHARLESTSPEADAASAGGMVKIATLVDELRENGFDNILLLDGGDAWHGTNVANVFEGKSVVEVMNLMGYDAMTLGNHDFNYGQVALAQRKGEAVFPVLAANVLEEGTGEPIAYSALIKPVGDLTVGIIGLVTTETPYVTHPKNVEGLVIADPIARAKSLVSYVRPQADVVIALTHLGFEADQVLAEAVPGIDVIVGGHSHTRLEEPVVIGDTYIVQVGEHAKELGYLELTLEDGQLTNAVRKLVPASADVADNGQVVETVDRWGKELEAKMGQEVGAASVILDGERANVRVKETNLGNLVADVMREAVGADIGVNNGGGIRASIAAGPITVGDIYTVLPFDNTLVKVEILGRDLLGALEHSVRLYPEQNGGFLQVSGLEMTFDPSQEAGARVQEVLIGGQALDPDKTYTVATNDFLAAGGDGYTTFTSANILVETGAMLRDAMADHVAAQGSISPEVEGRIVAIE